MGARTPRQNQTRKRSTTPRQPVTGESSLCPATPVPDRLYHYLSMDALTSVLGSGCLWISDAAFTNDGFEGGWLDFMTKLFLETTKDPSFSKHGGFYEVGCMLADCRLLKRPFYIACFSEVGDLLSQWRAYADDGRGVSIGFDLPLFELPVGLTFNQVFHQTSLGCTIDRVLYEEQEQLETIRRTASFLEQIARTKGLWGPYYEAIRDTGRDCFLYLSTLFKHPGFSEEREWRIIYDGVSDRASNGIGRDRLYRTRGNEQVGYFRFNLQHCPMAIREIVLGPKCPATVAELSRQLENGQYTDVVVRRSELPYR